MDFGSFDRRQFLAGGGAAFVCTLAGHKLFVDQPADLPKLARGVQVPPKVAAAGGPAGRQFGSETTAGAVERAQRQYWIRAEERGWNIVPTGRDEMMDKKVKGDTSFKASPHRTSPPNFGQPLKRGKIPGPLIDANIGETIAVHFQNGLKVPVTMHPHASSTARRWTAPTRASTRTRAASSSRARPSPTSGTRARGPRGSGFTTTTGPWTRSRSTRA